MAHEAAVLGAVTFAANNHVRSETDAEGVVRTRTLRDSAAARRPKVAKVLAPQPRPEPPAPSENLEAQLAIEEVPARRARPALHVARAAAARAVALAKAAGEEKLIRELCTVRAAGARPSSAPSAAARLAALRARVLAKAEIGA